LILEHFNAKDKDEGAERVPPMALVRCSRGGKTRSLRELACLLKTKLPDVAVIFISLNDFSTLETWENNDQIGALCRRIAYMSLKDRALLSRIQVRECPEGHHPVVVGDIEVCAFDRRAGLSKSRMYVSLIATTPSWYDTKSTYDNGVGTLNVLSLPSIHVRLDTLSFKLVRYTNGIRGYSMHV
jgi:hypothetical protein